MNNNQVRYLFAAFFILCGLIIGVMGGYESIAFKHYEGEMQLDNPLSSELKNTYPYPLVIEGKTLVYDFEAIKTWDLPYTTDGKKWLWLFVPMGLVFVGLGVDILRNENVLFEKAH